ncbi:hypothetical protein BTM29_01070 [Companilactobacillus allii]|uniref:MmcQ family protein n=1 Tax=Companilactobacillus allii TaxID=1847728 RepID=A0A1P8Q622_9LACO|nr:hypothetical protein BTM29_01070 [Companilactobacillus allii]
MTDNLLKNKKLNSKKAIIFGFKKMNDNLLIYQTDILNQQFQLIITLNANSELTTKLIEISDGNEYRLHLDPSATGSFVNSVRNEFLGVINEIVDNCFDTDIFKNSQTKQVIEYVNDTYDTELEFLWEKFPNYAALRRLDNKKWYGLLMIVNAKKIGLDIDGDVEVLDLRIDTDKMEQTIDNKTFFPGYHMNKKHWYAIYLNDGISNEELFQRINNSYILADK